MDLLKLKIVTPEKVLLEEMEIESLTVPTPDGEITILPYHVPLISQVIPGEIIYRKSKNETSLVTTNGFLKLNKIGEVLILADYAIRSEDIEIAKVEEAKKKAEENLKEHEQDKDFVIAQAELRRMLLELKVAQKRKRLSNA